MGKIRYEEVTILQKKSSDYSSDSKDSRKEQSNASSSSSSSVEFGKEISPKSKDSEKSR
jgi:hypothetical protein